MKKLKLVSVFSGAGGLDLGLEAAGFRRIYSIEHDPICCETLLANSVAEKEIFQDDVHLIDPNLILKNNGLKPGELDLIAGGPPCQPFSKSGLWVNGDTPRMDDKRATTLVKFMDMVYQMLPKAVLIENVPGIKYKNKNEGLQFIKRQFDRINTKFGTKYKLCTHELNAKNFGVPQSRARVFMVAFSSGKEFTSPTPTHGPRDDGSQLNNFVTAYDAIGDTEDKSRELKMTGKWAELLPTIPPGKNYLWHTPKMNGKPIFGWRTRFWNFLLKLEPNSPSWTITASPGSSTGPFHWSNRKLSQRELARLQSFPESYKFSGTYNEVRRQIGNAVPPLLGEVIGLKIIEALSGVSSSKKLVFGIPSREGAPTAPKVSRVPKKYSHLYAEHANHPGVGKGPGARKVTVE